MHTRVRPDAAAGRLNVLAASSQLLEELEAWRRQLPGDVARARARGFVQFAADLERLHRHVTATWTACRQYAQQP